MEKDKRAKKIIGVGILGVVANMFLVVMKAVIGLIANSIAITVDALNNLTDSLSSSITIVGTKLANKKPDKEHPFGHGRGEYLTAMIVSLVVLYAGITALIEAIKRVITPIEPNHTYVTIIIVTIAILVKVFLSIFFILKGKKYNSDALIASGKDAVMDIVISLSTLVSVIVFMTTNLNIEAYLGIVISLLIIKTGIDILRKAISSVLGERVDPKLATSVKETVTSFEEVHGAYDLILDNYGPDTYMGSVHIEVDENISAKQLDKLTRKIMKEVYIKHGVILNAIGLYSTNIDDDKALRAKARIEKILSEYESVLQMHGFYFDEEDKTISFDIIVAFDDPTKYFTYESITRDVKSFFEDYEIIITMDVDASE